MYASVLLHTHLLGRGTKKLLTNFASPLIVMFVIPILIVGQSNTTNIFPVHVSNKINK